MNVLLESKGTPNVILDIINRYETELLNSFQNLNPITILINESNLRSTLLINFKKGKNFSANLNFRECIDSDFKKCEINLYFPKIDINLIFKSLIHELTHLYELFQIKDFYSETKWKRSEVLVDTKFQNINPSLHYFRDIFYLSLPHEVNAIVSSLYKYLFDTKIKDKNELEKILIKTIEWQNMLNLKDFSYEKCYNNLIEKYKINKQLLYDIFNLFNLKMEIKTKINSDIDLYNYLKNSSKYFKSVSVNYKEKMLKVLYRTIEDRLNENYLTSPTKIVNYDEYIEEYKKQNKDINYLNFL
jgi:hypothetical protein